MGERFTRDGRTNHGKVSPQEHEKRKSISFDDPDFRDAVLNRSYLIIGAYNDQTENKLEMVKSMLDSRPGCKAFLLKEMPEDWGLWTAKFGDFVNAVNYVVGVFEHSKGGHNWELGYLEGSKNIDRTYILKRDYSSKETEREQYDAMLSHCLMSLNHRGQCLRWENENQLVDNIDKIP